MNTESLNNVREYLNTAKDEDVQSLIGYGNDLLKKRATAFAEQRQKQAAEILARAQQEADQKLQEGKDALEKAGVVYIPKTIKRRKRRSPNKSSKGAQTS